MTAEARATAEPEAADPLLGVLVGEYEVLERIGAGGMGIVYRARQRLIGKEVALKVLRPEIASDPEFVRRLLGEARSASAIHHRGIIDIFGFGHLPDERPYLVMEHLRGAALDEVLARTGALPVPEALAILEEALDALGAAHEAGVVHRDLKPSNVFLEGWPGVQREVKLVDFGLAKELVPGGLPAQTTRSVAGTPSYIAPEQVRGEPSAPAADLYSMGILAFEMLAGQCPFQGETAFDVLDAHVRRPAPSLSSLRADVPAELDTLVARLLAKEPQDRPPSARQVAAELGRLRRSLSSALTGVGPAPAPLAEEPRSGPRSVSPLRPADPDRHPSAPTELALPLPSTPSPPPVRVQSLAVRLAATAAVLTGVVAFASSLVWWLRPEPSTPRRPPARQAPVIAATVAAAPAPTPPLPPEPPEPREKPRPKPAPVRRASSPPPSAAREKEPSAEALRQRAEHLRGKLAARPRDVRAELLLSRAEQLIADGKSPESLRKAGAMLDDLARNFVH